MDEFREASLKFEVEAVLNSIVFGAGPRTLKLGLDDMCNLTVPGAAGAVEVSPRHVPNSTAAAAADWSSVDETAFSGLQVTRSGLLTAFKAQLEAVVGPNFKASEAEGGSWKVCAAAPVSTYR